MERILIIQNFLGLIALTKKEKATLIRELVSDWHFSESEVIEAIRHSETEDVAQENISQVTDIPAAKKRGRKKITKTEDVPEQPKRRRGRPKKVKDDYVSEAGAVASSQDPSYGHLSAADAALIDEAQKIKNISCLLDEEPEKCSKATRKRNSAFKYLADFPALKKFVIGQEYSFEFVYQWDDKKLLSPLVLTNLMPIGIYIPYKNLVFGKYRGFIVSIYDEKVLTDIAEARSEAAAKPVIDDEAWAVMDSLQWSVLKSYINAVNRMLSKVGGDLLKAQYRTSSPNSNMVYGMGGFRYTVNVK